MKNLYPVTKDIIKYAQSKGCLDFKPHSLEFEEEYIEPVSGHVSSRREGFWAEDIDGYYIPTIKNWILSNIESIKEAYREKDLKNILNYINFSTKWSQWAWTIDSIKSVKYEIAFSYYRMNSSVIPDDVFNKITDLEINLYLNKNYNKLNDIIYVGIHDPSVFLVDERIFSFDLKHGWSKAKLEEIMSLWIKAVTNLDIKSKLK